MEEKFVVLINENYGIIMGLCKRNGITDPHNIKDMSQEIIYRAWSTFNSFRGDCKFSTWLYSVARNTIIDFLRKLKHKIRIVQLNNIFYEIVDESDKLLSEKKAEEDKIDWVLSKLTSLERKMIDMYLDIGNYKKMEEFSGLNENYLRVNICRIKTKIKKLSYQYNNYNEDIDRYENRGKKLKI